jgi:hypothetical protein
VNAVLHTQSRSSGVRGVTLRPAMIRDTDASS